MLKRFLNLKAVFRRALLSSEEKEHWNTRGFLVLKGFFSAEKIDGFLEESHRVWRNRTTEAGNITIDVLEGELKGQRILMRDAPDSVLNHAHKVNDLFLDLESCRSLNLDIRLSRILGKLLDGKPAVINSLSFIKGSQQPFHFDTYFMPPPVRHRMVVSSICLEDQTNDSGPLTYFPGSQKIEPWVFDHGGINAMDNNLEQASSYATDQISRLNLEQETFVGDKGDVFIWHSQLYHGGMPINNPKKTRRTLVTHYWRSQDLEDQLIKPYSDSGDYMRREHPQL